MQVLKAEMFETVVDGAARVFAQASYRRAMMSDIAAEARVSLATVYRYAPTKEVLFELALRRGFGMPLDVLWTASTDRTGFEGGVAAFVRDRFEELSSPPVLSQALRSNAPANVRGELQAIAGELYDGISRYRLGIRILDRSTADWPDLASLFVARARGPVLELLRRYLARRSAAGAIPCPTDGATAARLILEICATLAMHRHFTSGGDYSTEEAARATAIQAITRSFGPSAPAGARPIRSHRRPR